MADRTEELRATAAQCLALSRSTIDPQTRNALLMAQPPRLYPQPTMQQQQQIQPKKEE
jgi:hypothetical protein